MIALDFRNARLEGTLRYPEDLLVGVGAEFEINVDSRVLFREPDFPIIELRVALVRWLNEGFDAGKDFVYDSVEHDEPGLVSIRRVSGSAGWRVGSIFQENSESRTWSSEQIARAVRDFVEAVDRWTAEELGVDVDAYLIETRR